MLIEYNKTINNMIKRFIFFLIQIGHHVTDHLGSVRAVVYVTLTAAPAEGVLEAGRDAEGPVAARGLVSGRDPQAERSGRDGARSAEGNRGITPDAK